MTESSDQGWYAQLRCSFCGRVVCWSEWLKRPCKRRHRRRTAHG